MEDREEEEEYDNSDLQEHGPELWFTNWERQCLSESERRERSEAEEADDDQRDRLWHLFQTSAAAVAQLYKDPGCHHHHHHHQQQQQQGGSLWVPFQNAATAVTSLYKESAEARQRSFDLGVRAGHRRRDKDVLSWAKKRQRTIRREDLIGFLCGKAPPPPPPPRSGRANNNNHHHHHHPRLADPPSVGTAASSSAETSDLRPFREAIALQALSGAMAGIDVCSGGAPGSPSHGSRGSSVVVASGGGGASGTLWHGARRSSNNSLREVDLSAFISKEMALHVDSSTGPASSSAGWGGARKRSHTQCGGDAFAHAPTHKRGRI